MAVSDFRYSPLIAALSLVFAPASQAVQTVSNDGDRNVDFVTNPGTLRKALEYYQVTANCTGTSDDQIVFVPDVIPTGPFTINVSSPLPTITCDTLTIDGNYAGTRTLLIQNVPYGGISMNGLDAQTASPIKVKNLALSNFSYGGALSNSALFGNINADNVVLDGNDHGFRPAGRGGLSLTNSTITNSRTAGVLLGGTTGITLDGNSFDGNSIAIKSMSDTNLNITNNDIRASQYAGILVSYGGSTVVIDTNDITGNHYEVTAGVYLENSSAVVQNNVISDNDTGVYLTGDAGSKIADNWIGTDRGAFEALGNYVGIQFGAGSGTSSGTTISGNTISASLNDYGIDLSNFSGVTIKGNNIGTDRTGNVAMANQGGILAQCGSDLTIKDNTISGNSSLNTGWGNGIELDGITRGSILHNRIGIQGAGILPLGNNAYGVLIRGANCGVYPAVPVWVESDALGFDDNTIAFNSRDGVLVASGVGHNLANNSIYDNGEKNINLGAPGGPRGNDLGDADGGPNNGQNYPVIGTAGVLRDWSNHETIVSYSLDSLPGPYRIDVYSNGGTARPAGKFHEAVATLMVPATGPALGTVSIPGLSASNIPNNITLTATSSSGDTSEFSDSFTINPVPDVTITPSTLTFSAPVNGQSPAQAVTLRSTGNVPYVISNINTSTCGNGTEICTGGPFVCARTCAPSFEYAPNSTCQISVYFAPLVAGSFTSDIAICDNTPLDSTRIVRLTGATVAPPPVQLLPAAFDFGPVLVGARGPAQVFQIRNPSAIQVPIGAVTSTGDFLLDSTSCGATLEAGSSCRADVTFAPTQGGPLTGTLSVSGAVAPVAASAKGTKVTAPPSASAALSGTGVLQADVQLPASLAFGAYTQNTPAIRRSIDIRNSGNGVLTFNGVSITGPFTLVNGCPVNLQPGDTCTLSIDYSRATLGDATGALTIVSNAVGGTRTIALTGRTVAVPAPQISVTPVSINFGDRLLGTMSTSQRVTISNIGNSVAVMGAITASPVNYWITGTTCGATLAPQATCFAEVAFRPLTVGAGSDQLRVNSNAAGSPALVTLNGRGCTPPRPGRRSTCQ